jgi:RNA-directed DNA polymerase
VRAPPVTPTLQRLAAQAARDPERVLTTRAQLLDEDWLPEASRHPSPSSAAGIDGVTATMSAEPLDDNRREWPARLHSGRDQAAPVERVWSEKDDGGQRPIGQPACADTSGQRAVAMVLAALDAQDGHDGASGVRPGRSPHAARPEVRERGRRAGIGWSVEAAVRGDVDSLDRTRRQAVRRQRVHAGRSRRLMGKWLRAGVREDGVLSHSESGVVPGGVRSPVLAKIVLHHVLDEWFAREVRPRLQGRCVLTRVADAFVIGCEREADARRILAVRPQRFARDGFTIHPAKPMWMAFRPPATPHGADPGHGTCACLGLPQDGTPSRRGDWVIKRRTARKRRRRPKKAWWRWCRAHRPAPRTDQYRRLGLKRRGQFQYDGMRGNCRLRDEVRREAEKAWRDWRSRRSRTRAIGWETFQRLVQTSILPTPTIVQTSGSVMQGSTVMRRSGAETLVTAEPYA